MGHIRLELSEELHRDLKRRALETGVGLRELMIGMLEDGLAVGGKPATPKKVKALRGPEVVATFVDEAVAPEVEGVAAKVKRVRGLEPTPKPVTESGWVKRDFSKAAQAGRGKGKKDD